MTRPERRREMLEQWEAEQAKLREQRAEHDSMFPDIVEVLQKLEIDPERLRDYLNGL